jgi:hypothetical protein
LVLLSTIFYSLHIIIPFFFMFICLLIYHMCLLKFLYLWPTFFS